MAERIDPLVLRRRWRFWIEKHRQAGDTLMIIYCDQSLYHRPIANAWVIDIRWLPKCERAEGRYTRPHNRIFVLPRSKGDASLSGG